MRMNHGVCSQRSHIAAEFGTNTVPAPTPLPCFAYPAVLPVLL